MIVDWKEAGIAVGNNEVQNSDTTGILPSASSSSLSHSFTFYFVLPKAHPCLSLFPHLLKRIDIVETRKRDFGTVTLSHSYFYIKQLTQDFWDRSSYDIHLLPSYCILSTEFTLSYHSVVKISLSPVSYSFLLSFSFVTSLYPHTNQIAKIAYVSFFFPFPFIFSHCVMYSNKSSCSFENFLPSFLCQFYWPRLKFSLIPSLYPPTLTTIDL